jgi:hypothetical protein
LRRPSASSSSPKNLIFIPVKARSPQLLDF